MEPTDLLKTVPKVNTTATGTNSLSFIQPIMECKRLRLSTEEQIHRPQFLLSISNLSKIFSSIAGNVQSEWRQLILLAHFDVEMLFYVNSNL